MALKKTKYKANLLKELALDKAIQTIIMADNPQAVIQEDRIDFIKCPCCNKPEGYIYFNNILKIQCNRLNECGASSSILEVYPDLDSEHKKAEIYLIKRGLDTSKFDFEQGVYNIHGEKFISVCFLFEGIKCHRILDSVSDKYRFEGKYQGKVYPAIGNNDSKNMWITESIIDALSLNQVGCNAIATLSASHLPKQYYLGHKDKIFVIAFDDDKAGNKATEKHEAFFKKNGVSYKVAIPAGVKDWNEALIKSLLNSVYLQSCMQEEYKEKPSLFSLYDPTNMMVTIWLVKGYIPEDAITLLFGESGAYKSFLAIDFACSVATGKNWQGQKTVKGGVIYICGEGKNGIQKRIKAWQLHHNTDEPSIHLTNRPVYILDKSSASELTDEIQKLIEKYNIQPKLIVIDTLARCFGAGDENGVSDMSKFLMHIDHYLRTPFQISILIVHHTGHTNTGRARGSYALHAGVDTEFLLRKQNGVSTLSCIKMKEDELSPEKIFKTDSIDIGLKDKDGVTITSLVLEEIDSQCFASDLSPSEHVAYDTLCHMIDGKVNVLYGDWLKGTGQNKSAFSKAVKILVEQEYVQMEKNGVNKYYSLMNDEDL